MRASLVQDAIQKPFESGDLHARERLIALLRRLAIRASKQDLTMLVGCSRKACPPRPSPRAPAIREAAAASHVHACCVGDAAGL